MPNPSSSSRPAIIALYAPALIWGYNWVVMKRALHYMGPFQFGAVRTLLAALILFAVAIALKKPLRLPHMMQVTLVGLLQTCGFTALIIWALVTGGAGKVAVLSYTMPFWVMLLAWPLLSERIRGVQWLAVIASVAGLVCILEPWHMHGHLLSDSLAVMSGLCWAAAVILAKKLHHRSPTMDLLSFTAWQMFLGSLPLVALAFLVPAPVTQWTPYLIGAMFYNVIACNALAWLLWLFALQRLPTGIASMVSLLTPVIAVLTAWLELNEIPSRLEVVGMLLIGGALTLIAVRGMHRHEAIESAMAQE